MKTTIRNIIFLLCFMNASWSHAQVVAAPDLQCVSVNNNGDVVLNWSLPVVTCGGPFNAYYIYWSTDINGPYQVITIFPQFQTSYTHMVGNGGTQTYYYYMASDYNCPGYTFEYSDTVDNLDPVTPEINFVTVNNGLAEINWQPSTSPESFGYIIYRVINGNFIPIDTVYGKFNTSYIDVNSAPGADSMSYSLATLDSCVNTGPINLFPQHTIYLRDSVSRCEQKVVLSWYFYDNWQNGIQKYDIEMSLNGAPYVILQSVPANVLSYTASGFNDGDSACFRIIAKENLVSFTSVSNELCAIMNVAQPVNNFYIRNITVSAPNEISVYYSLDSLSDVAGMTIERGFDRTTFTELATIPPPYNFSATNLYIDLTPFTDVNSYFYRLIARDSCGGSDTSTVGKSILLKGYAFTDLSFFVTWDQSEFDSGKVLSYDLYRDDGTGWSLVSSESPEVFSYEESDLATISPCYYVNGVDSMVFPNGINDTIHSRSNIVCLNQPSVIYMPNAFAPLGQNNIFKPILNVEGVKSYSFMIFNRWGQQLFSSNSPADGWDGKFKDTYVMQGAYAYIVNVVDDKGKQIEAKGTVMVVR